MDEPDLTICKYEGIEDLREVLKGVLMCLHNAGDAGLGEIKSYVSDASIKKKTLQKMVKHKLVEEMGLVQINVNAEKPYSLTNSGKSAINTVKSCIEKTLQQHQYMSTLNQVKAQEYEMKLGRWLNKGAEPWRRVGLCDSCGKLIQSHEIDMERARALLDELCTLFKMTDP